MISSKKVFALRRQMLSAALIMLAALPAISATPAADESPKALIAKWDQGTATIEVTNYPVAARAGYELFAVRCARCHKLARSVNADYVLPDEWEPRIERMRNKWFSGIDKETGKRILDFLVYDASVRKKPRMDAALAKLSAESRKAAEDRIMEIRLRCENKAP